MQALSCFTICRMGFFHGVKTSKVDHFFVVSDRSLPAPIGIFHPRKTTHTFNPIFIGAFAVCSILTMGSLTKVLKPVVRFISIDVVNLCNWKISSYIKPCKPMGRIRFPINFNIDVSFIMQMASSLANFNFRPWCAPMEKTRHWVVRKNGCEVAMFHASYCQNMKQIANLRGGSQCLTN